MKNRRQAFSIVEMLLVVSLLILLGGLLSPALNSARQTAKAAACAANLRQVGVALMNYSTENLGFFPIPSANNNGTIGGWAEAVWPYAGYSTYDFDFDETYDSAGQNIFKCPVTSQANSDDDRKKYRVMGQNRTDLDCSYGMNIMPQYLFYGLKTAPVALNSQKNNDLIPASYNPSSNGYWGDGSNDFDTGLLRIGNDHGNDNGHGNGHQQSTDNWKAKKKAKQEQHQKEFPVDFKPELGSQIPAGRNAVQNTSETALILENCQLEVTSKYYFDDTAFFPHHGGANVLFFDGHVELLKKETIQQRYPDAPDDQLAPFWSGQ